jgi:MFS transporter, FSR family, fosmidomycin resistance protein
MKAAEALRYHPAMHSQALAAPGAPAEPAARRREDLRTIGLVGLAHGTSHFFHMLLPPLFPVFKQAFGVSYAELGLAVSLFFVISGIGQALAGFLVDRIGARPVLFAALGFFVAAALTAAGASDLNGILLAAALAGLGNSPFHPIDFTILNQRVAAPRLGHAFSVHGISGTLGWALSPVFIDLTMRATGSWRLALVGCALWALAVLALMVWQRDAIDDRALARAPSAANPANPASAASGNESPYAFLRLPSVWLCFSFFFFSTCALSAILSFSGPALSKLYGLSESTAKFAVTGFTLASVVGLLIGGFLAARAEQLERLIGLCLAGAATLLVLVGLGVLPAALALALTMLAGVGYGLAGPSRDMLIKRAAPPGATGRVYGTVYSGLDVGFAIAAPIFGALLDGGWPAGVFHGAAVSLALGVAAAALIGLRVAATARRVPASHGAAT